VNRFSATTESSAVVAADRAAIWAVLTDPVLLPKLTPLLERIDAEGDLWRWHMKRIAALGVAIIPSFDVRMKFQDHSRIDYEPNEPDGVGPEGWYVLGDTDGGTELAISLTLHLDLPLPKASTRAVRKVMTTTMTRTGDRFSTNLSRHLGIDGPSAAATRK
jgi:hypothetical protein